MRVFAEDAPDQISSRQRSAELRAIAQMRADADALVKIDDYATASMFALERFAEGGDERARVEIRRRRGW